jgi:hypothetical protein
MQANVAVFGSLLIYWLGLCAGEKRTMSDSVLIMKIQHVEQLEGGD